MLPSSLLLLLLPRNKLDVIKHYFVFCLFFLLLFQNENPKVLIFFVIFDPGLRFHRQIMVLQQGVPGNCLFCP